MKAKTFKSFLREDFEPYKLVILTHSAAGVRDTKSEPSESGTELLKKTAKQLGIQVETADFVGAYTKKEGDKRLLYSFEFDENGEVQLPSSDEKVLKYQKPIVCDPKNTIIMPRGLGTLGFTTSRGWYDLVKEFEYDNFFVVNDLQAWNICTSKYLTYVNLKRFGFKSPKTVAIEHSEAAEAAFKRLKTDFPIILKSSTGTQTGIGVVIIESMRTLRAVVQMLLLYEKYLPLILQEYIETDYDLRVVVCNGKVIGGIKREVMSDDIRSNVSLGAVAEEIELTELEKQTAIDISEKLGLYLSGVDFIPSEDRENIPPYCLEVNANLGLMGIEKRLQGSPTKKILQELGDRDSWNTK
ncbi:MAG: ATP-grasp domain-containing protein [Pelagibacteraceae bacterium TMED247]|nr:MAG: ATP-grasp domain-containing protein [Pelagibacteraceae bacterium TMED247]|tara:strand:- start:5939 stop:7003 length:1065 start_codon:yes stop_codon:yes gene_type:complete